MIHWLISWLRYWISGWYAKRILCKSHATWQHALVVYVVFPGIKPIMKRSCTDHWLKWHSTSLGKTLLFVEHLILFATWAPKSDFVFLLSLCFYVGFVLSLKLVPLPQKQNYPEKNIGKVYQLVSCFIPFFRLDFRANKKSQAMKRGTYVVSILFTSLAMPSAALRHDEGNDGGMMTRLGISCEVVKSPDSIHFTSSLGMFKSQVPVTVRCCCFLFLLLFLKTEGALKNPNPSLGVGFFRPKKGRVEETKNHFGLLSGKLDKQKNQKEHIFPLGALDRQQRSDHTVDRKNPANHLWCQKPC